MANDKNKIVENYLMESLNYINPDQCNEFLTLA